jgi:hypothetical protein
VDFDPGAGTATVTANGSAPDAFVSELDAAGLFVDAHVFSGNGTDDVIDVAMDAAGRLAVSGRFTGTTDFDPGPGTAQLVSAGASDVFTLQLGAAGGAQPDLFEVELATLGAREAGVSGTVYAFGVFVAADANLLDAAIVPPGGGSIPLVFDPAEGAFVFESAPYATLAALRADYPTGEYLLEMNGGSSSVALDYPELEPQCFADITFPGAGCAASTTPTLTWELPAGCAATAIDAGLELAADEEPLFELTFIPGAAGSIALPSGPVTPTPLDPLPPLSPLAAGATYLFGVDVVEGTTQVEVVGADDFLYGTYFRHDSDVRFTASDEPPLLQLQLGAGGLAWSCGSPAGVFDVVRGDLTLLASAGLTASTDTCVADDQAGTALATTDPGPGEAYWYLVREDGGSYGSGGAGEQAGRDAAIEASGVGCS